MLTGLKNHIAFFRQFRQRFETTGSIAPSSRFLANSMTRFLAQRDRQTPIRVLEIGPGTGPVTNRVVQLLQANDCFDLVELNEEFVKILHQRFHHEPDWMRVESQSTLHQCALQEFAPTAPYDFVISGLPHNNFPADAVASIMDTYFRLLKPGGVLSYFEYMYIRPVRRVISFGPERLRVIAIDDTVRSHLDRRGIRRDHIWVNFPPAWVQHLQKER